MSKRPGKRPTNPVDIEVGRRIMLRRRALGISQEALAGELSVSFQQVQKYEKGANRVGAGRLYDISVQLRVPITYFYENLPLPETVGMGDGPSLIQNVVNDDPIDSETMKLARAFARIDDPAMRKQIAALVNELVKRSNP